MTKEEILKIHLEKYYRNKGKGISNDDILPVSRILPLMDQYAQSLLSEKWVSVEERLPEEVPCFVAYKFGVAEAKYFNGKFLKDLEIEFPGVTHWMYLPKAPTIKGI